MNTKIIFTLLIITWVIFVNSTVNVANAALSSYMIDFISIEGTDIDGQPSSNDWSIRGIKLWLEGQIDESDDEYLGNLIIRRSDGTEILVKRGILVGSNPGHDLRGSQGTTVNSNSEIKTNTNGEFYLSFILPFNAVKYKNDTLYLFFTETSDGQYNLTRNGKNQFVNYDVQVPRYSDADVDDQVYRNGDLIDIDLELETDYAWPGAALGQGIEVLTILPDFSNVDSEFAGGNSKDPITGEPMVPIGKVPNDRAGRYDLTRWNPANILPDELDLYDLALDVKRAKQEGRLLITDEGRGDYNVRYVISGNNLNEPGMKRAIVYALDYPSILVAPGIMPDIFGANDIFDASGLNWPDDLNIAVWKTTYDLDGDGNPGTEDINLDNRAPNFDFAIINPFVNPPCARWMDVDGDGSQDLDEWVYLYKEGDVISVMVSIDPQDLTIDELDEIDTDQIFPDGNEDATIDNISIIGDISALLDPVKVDLTTDANNNGIPDRAEVRAYYAGSGGSSISTSDDDFDNSNGNDSEDEEDKTTNGFDERLLFVINVVVDNTFKGISSFGPAVTGPLPFRFIIRDNAENINYYSAWREKFDPILKQWQTVPIDIWDRDTGLFEPGVREPVYIDDILYPQGSDTPGFPSLGQSAIQYTPTPARAKVPQWDRGFNILQNWDRPWRIMIDAAAPSLSVFNELLLEVPSTTQPNGPVPPLIAGGKSVLETGNFIYEIGGAGLVTLQASFPSDTDVEYVKFMYSDTGYSGSYKPMKGQYVGDVNIAGLYDVLGEQRDPNYPGAEEGLWHNGLNGNDDGDLNSDYLDSQVYNALYNVHKDGIDNDVDGLIDAEDANENNFNSEVYVASRDDDEDGMMDEDEYVVPVINGFATWTFDPVRIARILQLRTDKAYAIKAVAYDCVGNAMEYKASPIYVIFRVIGKDVEIPGSATIEIYHNGQSVDDMGLRENYTYDIYAVTNGTVHAVAFQYSMDKWRWVNIPTASGEPNPDTIEPFRISWRPTLSQLASDLWIDANKNGIKDFNEPAYQLGEPLFIRVVAYQFNPNLGKYQVVNGLFIDPQTYIPYSPQIFAPLPTEPQDLFTAVSNKPSLILELQKGLNLISICIDPGNTAITSVLSSIAGSYNIVWNYDEISNSWLSFRPGNPYNNLFTIEPKKAYWIDMAFDDKLIVEGAELENTNISLHPGRNMVGYCSIRKQDAQSAMYSISSKNFCIWTYNSTSKSWLKYSNYLPDFLNNSLNQLEPGKGYIIDIDGEGIWTVSP